MIQLFALYVVPAHRVLFVVTTLLVGVAGSLLANEPRCIANWIACFGAGLGMFVGDICKDIDSNARPLARSGPSDLQRIRESILRDRRPNIIIASFILSAALTLAGFILSS